jgi:hypothetical protein
MTRSPALPPPSTRPRTIPSAEKRPRLSRLVRRPFQGWSSVLALGVMLLVTGWVADETVLIGVSDQGRSLTEGLPLIILLGGIVGTMLAASTLGLVKAHVLGAFAGSFVILVVVASSLSGAGGIMERLETLDAAVSTYLGTAVRSGAADAAPVLLLVLGAIFWTTGQFAAFAVFRHGRAAPAIIAAGILLLIATSVTQQLQLLGLAAFTAASLLLVVRLNLTRQQQGWSRRHIGNMGEVSRLFFRSGFAFGTLALVTAVGLSAVASGAPLAHAWRDLDDRALEWHLEFERFFRGPGLAPSASGSLFGPRADITGRWEDSTQLDFIASSSDKRPHYWRGAMYPRFDGFTWWQTVPRSHGVGAGEGLLDRSADAGDLVSGSRRAISATVSSVRLEGTTLLAPAAPETVDRSADVRTSDVGGPLQTIDFVERLRPGESFSIAAKVPLLFPEKDGITGNQLSAAGRDYPPFIFDGGFLEVLEGSVGDRTRDAAREVRRSLPAADRADPYRLAVAVQDFLRDPRAFEYSTDVVGRCDAGVPVPECLLRTRVGYCQHYATTMVMMLRMLEVPARYVQGYLPGERVAGGAYEVDRGSRHAWVEVYFPEHGWIQFDPTPGQEQRGSEPTRIEDGPPVDEGDPIPETSFEPEPGASPSPSPDGQPEPSESPAVAVPPAPGGPGGLPDLAVLILVLLVGAAAVVVLALARLRHLPAPEADRAYRGVVGLATRLGYGPKPTQTVYEYVDTLSEVIPSARKDLTVVGEARVVSAYGGRRGAREGMDALRSAYGRVRLALVGLFFRRRDGAGRSRRGG